MNLIDILALKRDGETLSNSQIEHLIKAYTLGEVADYQMSAFLMAGFIRGLNAAETSALTRAMLYSGEVLDLSEIEGIKVDKHSTGGVGDKISIPLAPIVAACGVPVPMISGRGLGHSGGTLDKLEAIPGFRIDLDLAAYRKQLAAIGLVLIGQTPEIAPADRKMYALRDVTATVPFVPFIASSIMSKKLAEGIDALVLDVKCGRGAFMQTEANARHLAETLTQIGESFGKKTIAWLTQMDTPLGYAVGNWLETAEGVAVLQGAKIPEVTALTLRLAGEMIYLGGKAETPDLGEALAQSVIDSGAAMEKWLEVVATQGGDPHVFESAYPLAPETTVYAPQSGFVAAIDALEIGKISVETGAGRLRKEDAVDAGAGILLQKKEGDEVRKGEQIATLYTHKAADAEHLAKRIARAYQISEQPEASRPLFIDRYTLKGWAKS